MGRRSVFISYRRQLSWTLARLVRADLIKHRCDIFVDLESLDSGEFPRKILSEIEAREHFIVLLQPGSLDRIGEDGDWLRREIAHALTHGRNIVPVTADGFVFSRDLMLPPDVARLPSFNAVPVHMEYFGAGMERLRERFLKKPPTPTAPPQAETRGAAGLTRQARPLSGKPTSAGAPVLPAPQLAGQHRNPDRVRLSWSKVSGASEYVLERAAIPFSYGDRPEIVRFRPVHDDRFREVYRGPDQSYDDITSDEVPKVPTGRLILSYDEAPEVPAKQWWRYRVRADASGQAGRWSDTLDLETGTNTGALILRKPKAH